jgi:hypothetical protein
MMQAIQFAGAGHMSPEEAVAVAEHQIWPLTGRALALVAHMSGGDVNPSPGEMWFNDETRALWAARAARSMNQA